MTLRREDLVRFIVVRAISQAEEDLELLRELSHVSDEVGTVMLDIIYTELFSLLLSYQEEKLSLFNKSLAMRLRDLIREQLHIDFSRILSAPSAEDLASQETMREILERIMKEEK